MRVTTRLISILAASVSVIGTARAEFRVDESNGAARYRYEFPLPPARGRFQPALSLVYTSYPSAEAGFGPGWSISLPQLTMLVENNVTHYYYIDGGLRKPLLPSPRDGSGRYVVDVEERYLSFRQFVLSTWYATDGFGNQYEFDSLPTDSSGGYYLTGVTDLDGNRVYYDYQGTVNGPRLASITYNAYDPSSPGSTAPEPQRTASTMYATGVALEFDYSTALFKNLRIQNIGSQGLVTVRRYEFKYQGDLVGNTPVSDLVSIQEFGKEAGQSLGPTVFSYLDGGLIGGITTPLGAHYAIVYVNPIVFGPTTQGA